jgi:hypothetical protein
MADRWQSSGNQPIRERFLSNVDDRTEAADLIRALLIGRQKPGELPEQSPSVRREYGA